MELKVGVFKMDINNVVCVGRMTRDVELQTLSSGNQVGKFGLAMNRVWTSNGQKNEKTTFIDVTVWGKMAENLSKYTKKGHRLGIVGRLEQDTWTDKQTGGKRSKLYVVAESFQFLETNKNQQNQGQGQYQQQNYQQNYQQPQQNYQQQNYQQPPQQQYQQPQYQNQGQDWNQDEPPF